jgi:hypothetical protein
MNADDSEPANIYRQFLGKDDEPWKELSKVSRRTWRRKYREFIESNHIN